MASGAFATLKDSSGADFQVAVGKNLIIDLIIANTSGASSPEKCEFGYSDDSSGTNYLKIIPQEIMSDSTTARYVTECLIRIPATKYPILKSTATNLNFVGMFRGMESNV